MRGPFPGISEWIWPGYGWARICGHRRTLGLYKASMGKRWQKFGSGCSIWGKQICSASFEYSPCPGGGYFSSPCTSSGAWDTFVHCLQPQQVLHWIKQIAIYIWQQAKDANVVLLPVHWTIQLYSAQCCLGLFSGLKVNMAKCDGPCVQGRSATNQH